MNRKSFLLKKIKKLKKLTKRDKYETRNNRGWKSI